MFPSLLCRVCVWKGGGGGLGRRLLDEHNIIIKNSDIKVKVFTEGIDQGLT